MKITKGKLRQIIKEELGGYDYAPDRSGFGTEEENRALDRRQQKEYAMALSTVLGISTEEVESMSPLEISELGTHIRNHYRNKLNKRPPPLADPHRTGEFTPREG